MALIFALLPLSILDYNYREIKSGIGGSLFPWNRWSQFFLTYGSYIGVALSKNKKKPDMKTRAGNGVGAEVLHPEPLTRSGWWPSLSHRTLELRELRGCKNTTENETAVFLTYVKKKKIRKVASTDKKEKKEKKKERETETSSHSG